MSKNENKKKKVSPITLILIAVLVVMAILSLFTTVAVGNVTRNNSRSNIKIVAAERAKVIDDYALWVENELTDYSLGVQGSGALENLNDSDNVAALQQFTIDFGNSDTDIDSVFFVDWNGNILADSHTDNVGGDIYKSENFATLQANIVQAGEDIYNDGSNDDPVTNERILRMYKGMYDESGKILGFTGISIPTANLVNDLAAVQISGLENTKYHLIDTESNIYLYSSDESKIGNTCDIDEISKLATNIEGGLSKESGIVDSDNLFGDEKKTITAYKYSTDYGWILLLTVPNREAFAMAYQLQIFILVFGFLILIIVTIFGLINKHQQNVNRRLGNQILKTEATKKSLETAMFKDILTEVRNRTSFEIAIDKMRLTSEHPCYFAMFDISELSTINAQFGNDVGDTVLTTTAQRLTAAFPNGIVYRTGDDEFIVTIEKADNSNFTYQKTLHEIGSAQTELMKPHETDDGNINVLYKVAVTRSCDMVSSAVIAVLKDMTKQSGITDPAQVNFVDFDNI